MKKIWNNIARDLWIVLLDIVAVNAAYVLALLIRFYVNYQFRPTVIYYLTDWVHFTPFYTILAIAVFVMFRLYGGMWRYAGINDMNRIIGASVVTTLIQIIGTALFIRRMPITYYAIGAVLQFLFIALIRFGYRVLLVEKKKMEDRKTPSVPSVVVGAGDMARKAIHHLEDTPFRIVVIVDQRAAGKTLDGIRIIPDFDSALPDVRAAFIADPNLTAETRKEIKEKCELSGIELHDYTGYLSNLGGRTPVSALLELVCGSVTLIVDGKETIFESGEAALNSLQDRYEIKSIKDAKVELIKPSFSAYAGYEAWAKQHKEQTGEDVSFF